MRHSKQLRNSDTERLFMATVVNQPPNQPSDSGMGFLIGIILLLIVGILLIYFGVPALRQQQPAAPTEIQVPDRIDVDINNGGAIQPGEQPEVQLEQVE
jgi:hypothetical protein